VPVDDQTWYATIDSWGSTVGRIYPWADLVREKETKKQQRQLKAEKKAQKKNQKTTYEKIMEQVAKNMQAAIEAQTEHHQYLKPKPANSNSYPILKPKVVSDENQKSVANASPKLCVLPNSNETLPRSRNQSPKLAQPRAPPKIKPKLCSLPVSSFDSEKYQTQSHSEHYFSDTNISVHDFTIDAIPGLKKHAMEPVDQPPIPKPVEQAIVEKPAKTNSKNKGLQETTDDASANKRRKKIMPKKKSSHTEVVTHRKEPRFKMRLRSSDNKENKNPEEYVTSSSPAKSEGFVSSPLSKKSKSPLSKKSNSPPSKKARVTPRKNLQKIAVQNRMMSSPITNSRRKKRLSPMKFTETTSDFPAASSEVYHDALDEMLSMLSSNVEHSKETATSRTLQNTTPKKGASSSLRNSPFGIKASRRQSPVKRKSPAKRCVPEISSSDFYDAQQPLAPHDDDADDDQVLQEFFEFPDDAGDDDELESAIRKVFGEGHADKLIIKNDLQRLLG